MAMSFNPYMASTSGMGLGSPSSSQGGINNLLGMQQQAVNDFVGAIKNFGKTSRTNTINDLIARGGLEGLNEAQAQARIQQEAGGTLTQEGQQGVDKLLQTIGKEDQRQFTTKERIGGQDFISGENAIKAEALKKAQEQRNTLDKLMNDQNLTQKEKDSLRDYMASMYGHEVTKGGQKQLIQGADGMQYLVDKPTGKLTKLIEGVLPYSGSGGKSKNGADELTGEIRKVWEDSTGKGKLALEEMYKTGDLQVVPIVKLDKEGKRYNAGQKMLYKGQPTTTAQLKKHLGLK